MDLIFLFIIFFRSKVRFTIINNRCSYRARLKSITTKKKKKGKKSIFLCTNEESYSQAYRKI